MVNNLKSTKDDHLKKWEQVYEDDETISVWKYNLLVSKNGPVQVETKYKTGHKYPTDQKKKISIELPKKNK